MKNPTVAKGYRDVELVLRLPVPLLLLLPLFLLPLSLLLLIISPRADALEASLEANMELFLTDYNIRRDTPFNPENRFVVFPENQLEYQLRPRIEIDHDAFQLTLNPRLSIRYDDFKDPDDTDVKEDYYLQDGSLSYHSGNVYVSLSRELLLWGASQFASGSNPFFNSNNQSNPFVESSARDFFQIQYLQSQTHNFSLIANIDDGRDVPNYAKFKPVYALKYDYVSSDYTYSLLVSSRDKQTQLGSYGQWTQSDALLLYADVALKEFSPALYVDADSSALGAGFQARRRQKNIYVDGLIGFSYTLLNGQVFGLEYRHNSEGYSDTEQENYYDLINLAASQFTRTDRVGAQSIAALVTSADPHLRTLNKNYLYGHYMWRDVIDDLSINFLVSHGLDDHSSQVTAVANYYLSDNWRLAGNFIFNHGDDESEHRRYIDDVFFIGLKYFFD